MRKFYLAVLAVLVAVGGVALVGWAAESNKSTGKKLSERLKESSPVHYHLAQRHYDEALKLLPDVKDIDAIEPLTGSTALIFAAFDDSADAYDMVQTLVTEYGANPTVSDRNGLTPLHYAVIAGNLAVVEFLVKEGADVNAAPDNPCSSCPKVTPLHVAYQRGNLRVAQFLESRGSEVIDWKTRADLELQAKIRETLEDMDKTMPDDVDPKEWKRLRFTAMFNEAVDQLEAAGRREESAAFQRLRAPLLEAIENTPQPAGMSSGAWLQSVMQNVAARVAANQ